MTTESLDSEQTVEPEAVEEVGRRWITGAALLIVADASFVVALSFTYLYLRGVDTEHAFHPPGSPTASLWWPWVVTGCMLVSLIVYNYGMSSNDPTDQSKFVIAGVVAVVIMALALALNLVEMVTFPFRISDNAYSSAVFVIAAGNVFHLAITLFLGIGMVNRVRRGLILGPQGWQVRIVGLWWAWVVLASAIGALTVSAANGTVG